MGRIRKHPTLEAARQAQSAGMKRRWSRLTKAQRLQATAAARAASLIAKPSSPIADPPLISAPLWWYER